MRKLFANEAWKTSLTNTGSSFAEWGAATDEPFLSPSLGLPFSLSHTNTQRIPSVAEPSLLLLSAFLSASTGLIWADGLSVLSHWEFGEDMAEIYCHWDGIGWPSACPCLSSGQFWHSSDRQWAHNLDPDLIKITTSQEIWQKHINRDGIACWPCPNTAFCILRQNILDACISRLVSWCENVGKMCRV